LELNSIFENNLPERSGILTVKELSSVAYPPCFGYDALYIRHASLKVFEKCSCSAIINQT
jgi:hypothetical protein